MQFNMEDVSQITTTTDKFSDEELVEFVSDIFKSKWKTSYDYQNTDPIRFNLREARILLPQIVATIR